MRKFVAGAASLLMALVITVATQVPSSASTYKQTSDTENDAHMEVGYSKDADGDGFTIYYITIWCDPFEYGIPPFGWDDIALDGHILSIRNLDTNNIKWSTTDSNSNVHRDSGGEDQCKRTWSVNEHYPAANSMAIYYSFTAQINNHRDYDDSMRIVINN